MVQSMMLGRLLLFALAPIATFAFKYWEHDLCTSNEGCVEKFCALKCYDDDPEIAGLCEDSGKSVCQPCNQCQPGRTHNPTSDPKVDCSMACVGLPSDGNFGVGAEYEMGQHLRKPDDLVIIRTGDEVMREALLIKTTDALTTPSPTTSSPTPAPTLSKSSVAHPRWRDAEISMSNLRSSDGFLVTGGLLAFVALLAVGEGTRRAIGRRQIEHMRPSMATNPLRNARRSAS